MRFPVDTDDFRVDLGDDGIAEIGLGQAGSMPTTGVRGHTELARLWRRLDDERSVRAILVRSEGKGFCAGGHTSLVAAMLGSEASRARVMREARDIVQGARTKRSLNHWLRAAWPAFEHSLALEMIGFAGTDAREGLAALNEKRAPRFNARWCRTSGTSGRHAGTGCVPAPLRSGGSPPSRYPSG